MMLLPFIAVFACYGVFYLIAGAYFSGHRSMRWLREWYAGRTLATLARDVKRIEQGESK